MVAVDDETAQHPGDAGTAAPERVRLRPDRIAYFPVMLFALGTLPLAVSSLWLLWLLVLPLACAVWVARARVVAAPVGVEVCNGLRVHRVAWADVEGFDVRRRGGVRLLRSDGRPLRLTAVTRRQLPLVLAVGERAAGVRAPSGPAGRS